MFALCALPPTAIGLFVLVSVSPEEILAGLGFLALPPILYSWSRWSGWRNAA
jgi:hypothetical protein